MENNSNDDNLDDFERLPGSMQDSYSWARPTAVDRTILMPNASTTRISIVLPKYEKKMLAIMIFDENGKPFLTPEGNHFYNLQKETILTGYETREIDLPGQEVFNVDLTSSYLTEFDVPALRSLISLYSDLQLQVLNGKDKLDDLYYVYTKIMGMVETAKAREGKTARLSKTAISEGSSKQQIIDEFQHEQKKQTWGQVQH